MRLPATRPSLTLLPALVKTTLQSGQKSAALRTPVRRPFVGKAEAAAAYLLLVPFEVDVEPLRACFARLVARPFGAVPLARLPQSVAPPARLGARPRLAASAISLPVVTKIRPSKGLVALK